MESVIFLLSNQIMKTVNEIRRANLRLLVIEHGGIQALADQIGKSYAQLSQWINASKSARGKPRNMGDDSARLIESKCGKANAWLDQDHDVTKSHELGYGWPFMRISQEIYFSLSKSDRDYLEGIISSEMKVLLSAQTQSPPPKKELAS